MKAERYQILLQGLIDESWSTYFSGMTLTSEPSGLTRLSGEIADQSALHGLLNKIRDLNLRLIAVDLLDSTGMLDSAGLLDSTGMLDSAGLPDSGSAIPLKCRYCRLNSPAADADSAFK